MKSFKVVIQILMIAAVAASVTACNGKGSKSGVRSRAGTRFNGTGGSAPGVNSQGQWGEVTGFNRQSLAAFLGGDDFGDVSSASGQQSGVRFYGNIDYQGYGQVYMYVFDSYAQNQGPIELPVFNCQGRNVGNSLVIQCDDGNGDLTLTGQEIGNEFKGQVSFSNGTNSLGQFRISACGFLGCY